MDSLSEVLALCRSERAVTARFSLRAPWALESRGVPGAMLRVAQGAPYWLQVQGLAPLQVQAGDLVLLPYGSAHVMASDLGLAPLPFAELIERHALGPKDENPLIFAHGDAAGAETRIDSVLLWISAHFRHSVLHLLPALLHLPARRSSPTPFLAPLMHAMVGDSLERKPGWRLAAGRLGDLVLAHVLGDHFARQMTHGQGWVRGLADPGIARAIAAIHRAPDQGWTVERLAREAAMSRSRFAERFKALVGQPPIGYLSHHRMAHAAQRLEAGTHALAAIAEACGYESERVFARAFKRWCGQTPRDYQKAARSLQKQFAASV